MPRQLNTHLLDVSASPIVIDGQEVGIAVSLGKQCIFYASNPEFAALDGKRFESVEGIIERIGRRGAAHPEK